MSDMERYTRDASESTCADSDLTPPPLEGDPCFASVGGLQTGFWLLVPAAALQWVLTAAVTWESSTVILQVRRSQRKPRALAKRGGS